MESAFVNAAIVWGALGLGLACVLVRLFRGLPRDRAAGPTCAAARQSPDAG
jgi:hypothetical protein